MDGACAAAAQRTLLSVFCSRCDGHADHNAHTRTPLHDTPPPITHSLTRHDEQLHVDTPVGVCREWNAARPEGERYAEHM